MAKKAKPLVLFFLLSAVFLGMFFVFGPGVYNDSDQYIKMHIHREPLYPLFLAGLRKLVAQEEGWLTAMGILQNLLAAFSICVLAEYVGRRFRLCLWQEGIVVLLGVMPYMITMFFSSLHLFLTNSVMSEALCLPLFTLFIVECYKMVLETERREAGRAAVIGLALAFALSLIRSQMMLAVLMWLTVIGARILLEPGKKAGRRRKRQAVSLKNAGRAEEAPDRRRERQAGGKNVRKRKKRWKLRVLWLLLAAAVTVCAFALRTLTVKSYNLAFNGHFINNTYGTVNTLTNILYAADREDGERIKDGEAREFFYHMYDLTEERQANYKYAGTSLREKTQHIEAWHDTVKYEMIEDVFYQYYDKNVTTDYIIQNVMADKAAGEIMKGILPGCFWRWLGNYLLIAHYGLIRSIAVTHPVINWVAAFIYLSAFALMWMAFRKEKEEPAVRVMAVALLAIAANVAAVSLTIMCLSRYMIYGFVPFYVGYFLLALKTVPDFWRRYGTGFAWKGHLDRKERLVVKNGRSSKQPGVYGVPESEYQGRDGDGKRGEVFPGTGAAGEGLKER